MITNEIKDDLKSKILPRVKSEDLLFPDTILIDNISYCNLRCSMCPHKSMNRKPGIMDLELYKKIIYEISDNNPEARIWMTFFGEGLALNDLHLRVKYAKYKGLSDVVLNTNGNLLNKKNSELLIRAGLDFIYVGVDAYYANTYEKIRVGGNLEKVVQGVLEYKELVDKIGDNNQDVIVQFVVMDENENEINEFIKFWNSRGITVKTRPKVSWAGKVSANNLNNYDNRLPCNWAMNTVNISDSGLVCLCSVDLDCEVIMGDIKKQSISEVWNGTLKEFRDKHRKQKWDMLPEKCQQCKDWQSGYADYID